MVVWVKLSIQRPEGRKVEVRAMVNSAYESARPEIAIPKALASELGVSGEGLVPVEKVLADGTRVKLRKLCKAANVLVVEKDRAVGPVTADLLLLGKGTRVLLSDSLTSQLGIVLLDVKRGTWCFADEIGRIARKSANRN